MGTDLETQVSFSYLDAIPYPIFVLDQDALILKANTLSLALLKMKEEVLLGQNWFELFAIELSLPPAVFLRTNNKPFLLESNFPLTPGPMSGPMSGPIADQKTFRWQITAVQMPPDQTHYLLTGQEMSELNRLQAENDELSKYFGVLIEHPDITIYEQDANFRFKWIHNPPLEFADQDFIGKSLADFLNEEEFNQIEQIKFRILAGELVQKEQSITMPSSEVRNYNAFYIPIMNRSEISGVVGILFDITRKKALLEREKQLAQERERLARLTTFVQDITHDLKTPIHVIESAAALLQIRISDEDVLSLKHVERILRASQRLSELINDFMMMVFLNSKEYIHQMTTSECDLGALLEHMVVEYQPYLENNAIKLDLEISEGDYMMWLAPEYFLRAMSNLLSNAIKYSEVGGQIYLRLYSTSDAKVIEFEDKGIGINAEELPYVFDRFYRTTSVRSQGISGTGLGLSITRGIIESYDGQISVQSVEGQGTTFRIEFPHWRIKE